MEVAPTATNEAVGIPQISATSLGPLLYCTDIEAGARLVGGVIDHQSGHRGELGIAADI